MTAERGSTPADGLRPPNHSEELLVAATQRPPDRHLAAT